MTENEISLFFSMIRERKFWYDFSLTQFLLACRVQEIAGLQKANIDFKNRVITIREVVVWSKKTKQFSYLKKLPKNGEEKVLYLSDELLEVLKARIETDKSNSPYVFHDGGLPLNYRRIQYNYEWALDKVGLGEKFSGTHFLRHSMATLVRSVTGSLDSVQALTGHKDNKLVQHYAGLQIDESKKAIIAVGKYMVERSMLH